MQTFFPMPALSARSFSQGDAFTSSTSHRMIDHAFLWCCSHFPPWNSKDPERSEFTGDIILSPLRLEP